MNLRSFQSLENWPRQISNPWKCRGTFVQLFAVALAALFCAAGCAAEKKNSPPPVAFDPAQFDGSKALFEAVGLVNQGARDGGTPGAEKAAVYLAKRLQAAGVAVETDVFTSMTPRGPRLFRNVIGKLPGSESNLILVCSHFDTKPGIGPDFQGANDSGSSSGVLLELARLLARREARGPEIRLVFFDGEESLHDYTEIDGFHGSRHYAQKLVEQGCSRGTQMILLDMIGDQNLTVTMARNNDSKLATLFLQCSEAEGARSHFTLWPYEVGDDHSAFLERGIPAVDIIDFDYGSAPGRNDYWHTMQDTTDKLSADSLQIIGRVTLRVLNSLIAEDAARPEKK